MPFQPLPGRGDSPTGPAWLLTGAMSVPRDWHTAILLYKDMGLVAGGTSVDLRAAVVETYDPAAGQWTRGGWLGPIEAHAATLLPTGQVLITGGDILLALGAATDEHLPHGLARVQCDLAREAHLNQHEGAECLRPSRRAGIDLAAPAMFVR